MEIYGERLILSKICIEDIDLICKIECDEAMWYFEESVQSVDAVRKKYLSKINTSDTISSYDFIIHVLVDNEKIPIGLANIWSYIEHRKSWEIGFAIFPEFRGKGYACEAVKLLVNFAFKTLHAHKVVGMCNANNKSSAKLMERIGMTKEGVFKEELFWKNQWTDQYYYSILDREFALTELET